MPIKRDYLGVRCIIYYYVSIWFCYIYVIDKLPYTYNYNILICSTTHIITLFIILFLDIFYIEKKGKLFNKKGKLKVTHDLETNIYMMEDEPTKCNIDPIKITMMVIIVLLIIIITNHTLFLQ